MVVSVSPINALREEFQEVLLTGGFAAEPDTLNRLLDILLKDVIRLMEVRKLLCPHFGGRGRFAILAKKR